jgi:hypothetical protein
LGVQELCIQRDVRGRGSSGRARCQHITLTKLHNYDSSEIRHNIWTGQGMEEINALARSWVKEQGM